MQKAALDSTASIHCSVVMKIQNLFTNFTYSNVCTLEFNYLTDYVNIFVMKYLTEKSLLFSSVPHYVLTQT
jgi:hypothetical protein